ncbi:hypothetical protein ACET68_07590, partial [Aeromonas rivipollensis]
MSQHQEIKANPLPPLLPLEYCTVDRAARLLGCEVEDILHWGAVGEIALMMNLDQWIDTVYGEIILEENQPIEHFVSVELSSFASFSGIELSSDIPTRTMAWLHGLWNVEPSVIQQSYLGHPLNKVELYVYYFDEIIELEQDEDDLEENEEESTREFNFEVQFPIKNQAAFRSSSKTTCGCLNPKHLRGLKFSRFS